MEEQQRSQKRQQKYSEMQQLVEIISQNQSESEQFISRLNALLDKTSGEEGSRSNSMLDLYQQLITFEVKNQDKYRNLNEQLSNLILERTGLQPTVTKEQSESKAIGDEMSIKRESKTPDQSEAIPRESYPIPHEQVNVGEELSSERNEQVCSDLDN